MMANKYNSVIYTGVTSDLINRVCEHKIKKDPKSFTAKYNVTKLVYYETTTDITGAIVREKEIKGWVRKKKIALIESVNP